VTNEVANDEFDAAGYGLTPVGWGERPAIVAVDFQQAFCDPQFAAGRSPHIAAAVEKAESVLKAGRAAGIPIVHTAVAWSHDDEFTNWKVPALRDIAPGSHAASIVPSLWEDTDIYLLKRYPSAFFGTDLSTILRNRAVDTVLIMGVTTSGCVRATILDSFSYGFKTIVVEDACGDQGAEAHNNNMRDVERRYADLIDAEGAAQRLGELDS
jgi:maleamate amidohydrolase